MENIKFEVLNMQSISVLRRSLKYIQSHKHMAIRKFFKLEERFSPVFRLKLYST